MKAYLAVDTAYQVGMVTLFCDGEVVFFRPLREKMAHGKEICPSIDAAREFCDNNGYALTAILVGLGPGSFVGVRIALATCLGYAFARNLPTLGFCSHAALAYTAKGRGYDNFYVFMKASGDLGYLTEYAVINGNLQCMVLAEVVSCNDFVARAKPWCPVFSDIAEGLAAVNPKAPIIELIGPSHEGVMFAASAKIAGPFINEIGSIRPNYVKAPNTSNPPRALRWR